MTSCHAVPPPPIDMLFAVLGSDAELVNEKLSKSEIILLCKVSNTLTEIFPLLESDPSAKPTVGPGTPPEDHVLAQSQYLLSGHEKQVLLFSYKALVSLAAPRDSHRWGERCQTKAQFSTAANRKEREEGGNPQQPEKGTKRAN